MDRKQYMKNYLKKYNLLHKTELSKKHKEYYLAHKLNSQPLRRKEKFTIKCPCGKEIITNYSNRNSKKFCSMKCLYIYRKRRISIPRISKSIDYYKITNDGKTINYHRFIMEKHLNIKLSPSIVVHHLNENKLDNRIENLVLMTRTDHNQYHILKSRIDKRLKEVMNEESENRSYWLVGLHRLTFS